MRNVLVGLQVFHVAFLLLHDWIPLGRLNDTAAVRRENPVTALIVGTLISTFPFALGLCFSLMPVWPGWLHIYLFVAYAVLLAGELQAWWIPYLLWPQPVRAARYAAMFGDTHAFLPERNGVRPNTLHLILHAATLATVLLLASTL